MERLKNKIALITGSNSGIGEAVARLFAQEGATVLLTARREGELKRVADEISENGGICSYVSGDVTKTEDVEHVVDIAIRRYGRIDILVNNAGIGDGHRSVIRMTDDFWDHVFDVDIKSVMRFTRAYLRHMVSVDSGSIVNVASIGGVYACAGAAYSAAKAGVINLTRNLAIQYYGTGIRINSVSPGGTDTPLFSPDNFKDLDKEMMDAMYRAPRKNNPGHLTPLQQAYPILFLASDEASGVNGENIVVDYGGCL